MHPTVVATQVAGSEQERGGEAPRLVHEATRELETIPMVAAAAVDAGKPPTVRSVYLATLPGADEAAIRAQAESILRRHGLECPAHAVLIATTPVRTPEPAAREARGRQLLFDSIDISRKRSEVACRVQLVHAEQRITGESTELDLDDHGGARAAARATLAAVERAAPGVRFGLEGVASLEAFGRRYVAVCIEAMAPGSHHEVERLYGVAIAGRSLEDAACFATLNAIERWLAPFTTPSDTK